jgi:hypothetical protein
MSSALREGGVLYFEVGVLGGISTFWYAAIGQIGLGPHLWLYSEQALESLFAQAGLIVQRVQYFGLSPYVILNKACGLVEAAAFRLLSAIPGLDPKIPRKKIDVLHERFLCFLHYRVGALAPRIGPLKLLVVARPEENATGG